jgi:hypothetical protein
MLSYRSSTKNVRKRHVNPSMCRTPCLGKWGSCDAHRDSDWSSSSAVRLSPSQIRTCGRERPICGVYMAKAPDPVPRISSVSWLAGNPVTIHALYGRHEVVEGHRSKARQFSNSPLSTKQKSGITAPPIARRARIVSEARTMLASSKKESGIEAYAPFVLRQGSGKQVRVKPACSVSPERSALNAMFFVSNLQSSSQAGGESSAMSETRPRVATDRLGGA